MRFTLWSTDKGELPANMPLTNNYAASADPTVSNDSTQGYTAGSQWINTVDGRAFLALSVAVGAAVWVLDAGAGGFGIQVAPVPHDTAATFAPADFSAGIITSNPAGAINLTLPLATAMDTAFPQSVANSAIDFSVVNTSATAANIDTMTTNTGWTLVGNMVVPGLTAGPGTSGRFRARKTGAGAWTLYRLS